MNDLLRLTNSLETKMTATVLFDIGEQLRWGLTNEQKGRMN